MRSREVFLRRPATSGGILVRDDFNRADGPLGVTSSGHPWTVHAGPYAVSGNQCAVTVASQEACVATVDPQTPDYRVSAAVLVQGHYIGLCARCSDANNLLLLRYTLLGTTLSIWRCEGGVYTQLAAVGVLLDPGDRLSLRVAGSSVRGMVNQQELLSVTSSFNLGITPCGFHDFSSALRGQYDDFEVTQ